MVNAKNAPQQRSECDKFLNEMRMANGISNLRTVARCTIVAVLSAIIAGIGCIALYQPLFDAALQVTYRITDESTWVPRIAYWLVGFGIAMPTSMVTLAIHYLLLRRRPTCTDHLCLSCGYFLIGTRSERCPECGMPIASVLPNVEVKAEAQDSRS